MGAAVPDSCSCGGSGRLGFRRALGGHGRPRASRFEDVGHGGRGRCAERRRPLDLPAARRARGRGLGRGLRGDLRGRERDRAGDGARRARRCSRGASTAGSSGGPVRAALDSTSPAPRRRRSRGSSKEPRSMLSSSRPRSGRRRQSRSPTPPGRREPLRCSSTSSSSHGRRASRRLCSPSGRIRFRSCSPLESARRSADAKGWRWIGEMEEIAAAFAAHDLPDGFHRAAAEVYRWPQGVPS